VAYVEDICQLIGRSQLLFLLALVNFVRNRYAQSILEYKTVRVRLEPVCGEMGCKVAGLFFHITLMQDARRDPIALRFPCDAGSCQPLNGREVKTDSAPDVSIFPDHPEDFEEFGGLGD
jgi:hypothetical protein